MTKYRRGYQCPFSVSLSDETFEGISKVIGPSDEPPASGNYLRVQCFIEGEEEAIQKERIHYHRQTIQWRKGQASKVEDPNNIKIGLLTIQRGSPRNRRHFVCAQLFRNHQLIGESPETTILFRLGKKDYELPSTEQPTKRTIEHEELQAVKRMREETFDETWKSWTVEDVAKWLKSLHAEQKLSEDYSPNIAEHRIRGIVLPTMTKEDWEEVGITSIGDRKLIEIEFNNLKRMPLTDGK
jgi:hypothetical protein